MFFGKRRTAHGDDISDADLMTGDNVKISFNHDDALVLADRFAGKMEPEEDTALAVNRAFRGVDVLRVIFAERSSAEGDNAALHIADREHQAITEPVVDTFFREL